MTDQPPSVDVALAYPASTETGQPAAESQGIAGQALFSIVIINHNYADYLHQAITSALSQTYRPLEVIVVDDGSTDGSHDLIRAFGTEVVPVFKSQSGHVDSFNAGYAAAKGDILLFLDADDVLYADCVTQVMQAWSPGLTKVQFRLDTIDADGVDQRLPFPYFPPDLSPEAVLRQAITFGVYPWTVSSGNAFARTYLSQLLPILSDRIFKSPDGYLNKLAPLYGPVKSVSVCLGAYRVHGKNAWAQGGDRINTENISRWLRFDALIHSEFVQRASAAGYEVKPYSALNNSQMLEYRLLSLRLAPGDHPFRDDSRLNLLARGFRGAISGRNISVAGRVVWMAWFLVLCVAPLPVVQSLFRSGRGQTRRGALAKWMIRLSRGSAKSLHV